MLTATSLVPENLQIARLCRYRGGIANPHCAQGSVCLASRYHQQKKRLPDNGLRIRYRIEHFLLRACVIPPTSDKIACCERLAAGSASRLATPLAPGEEESAQG